MLRRILKSIRTNVLVGLILVTPIVVTAFVVNWLFTFITNRVLVFLPKHLRDGDHEMLWRVAALVIVLLLLFMAGLFIRNIMGRRLFQLGDLILERIPVINRIYIATRQVIEALVRQRQTLFQEVVLLQYPRPGVYAIGFVTAVVPPEFRVHIANAQQAEECLSIFIPTTPNPTSGWLCIVPRSQTIRLNMNSGEAMRLIVSGGAVFPGDVVGRPTASLFDMLHDWMAKEETPGVPGAKPPPGA